MNTFLNQVGQTPLSQLMQNQIWMIATIQAVHIFALAVVFTSAAAVDLRLLGVIGRGQTMPRVTSRFLPAIGWGVAILLATGLLLMIAEPKRAILNPYFQVKMAALVIVSAATWALGLDVAKHPERWLQPERHLSAKAIAIGSLCLWVLIIVAGRWIAYGP